MSNQIPTPAPTPVTVRQAAAALGVPPRTIRSWLAHGRLSRVKEDYPLLRIYLADAEHTRKNPRKRGRKPKAD